MKHFYDLTIFDEGPAAAQPAAQPATPAEGSQEPAKTAQPAAGFSFAQVEEIATARAEKAARASTASYFRQLGMSEQEVTEAVEAYKAYKKAKEPDIGSITKERDEAKAKLEAYEQREALSKKGVKAEFAEFVAFKARELMATDDKIDTFDKAADKFLKDNPHYGAPKTSYRVKASTEQGAAGAQGAQGTDTEAVKARLNAAIKSMARRK